MMPILLRRLRTFGADTRGILATAIGLGAPVVCVFAAGASDIGDVTHAQSSLQRSAERPLFPALANS